MSRAETSQLILESIASMAPAHEAAVKQVAAAVRAFFARQEPFRVFHGSTNSTRPAHGARVVDISTLNNILEINGHSRTAIVEPNVPMDKLTAATLAYGMVPPVVMEFPAITVGGGFAGSAGESSSFRYGYFSQTVKSIEMVLATGDVVRASPSENPDLFHGAGGTAGTLGIVTKLELDLIPAKQYVKLAYYRYNTVAETIAAVRRATEDSFNDYVDGILFSPTHGVVMTGHLTDTIPASTTPQTFSGAWDPWFYLHAKERTFTTSTTTSPFGNPFSESEPEPLTDYIPLPEYLFRYDRGGFWVGALAFSYFRPLGLPILPFNRFTRWFVNDFMHTRMLYRALQGSRLSAGTMVQDLALPYSTAEKFVEYTSAKLGIWPLWLCPLKGIQGPTFHPSCCDGEGRVEGMVNIGVWGKAEENVDGFVRQNRELEGRLSELGGRKVLYSQTFYREDEFWGLYDRGWYEELRERYGAGTLPSLWEKVNVDVGGMQGRGLGKGDGGGWRGWLAGMWPLPGVRGIFWAIKSKDYLIHRQPCWTYWKDVEAPAKGTRSIQ